MVKIFAKLRNIAPVLNLTAINMASNAGSPSHMLEYRSEIFRERVASPGHVLVWADECEMRLIATWQPWILRLHNLQRYT